MTRSSTNIKADIESLHPWTHLSGEKLYEILRDLAANASATGDAAPGAAADVWAATAGKFLTADLIASSAAFVAMLDAATVAFDWTAGINRSLTLTGDHVLGNPTGGQPGTKRLVKVTQGPTEPHLLTYGNQYKFAGGVAPTLSVGAAAVDTLEILCVTSTLFYLSSALNWS
jgi:hypothetical protein